MASVSQVRSMITTLHRDYDVMKTTYDDTVGKLSQCKQDLAKMEARLVEVHKRMSDKDYKSSSKQQEIKANEERIADLERTTAECQKMSESLAQKLIVQDESIERLENEINKANSEAASSSAVYSEALQRLRDARTANEKMEKSEEEAKKTITELMRDINTLTNKLRKLEAEHTEATERRESLQTTVDQLTTRLDLATQSVRQSEITAEELGVQVSLLEEDANDWTEKSKALRVQLATIKSGMQES